MAEITNIFCVEARDMPPEVEDYCIDQGIQTHCQNDVALVEDDGNPFAEWLKAEGVEFSGDPLPVGIIST
jgi:hypothetical protein